MAYTLKQDPEKPIFHSWVSKDFNLHDEFLAYLKDVKAILDGMNSPAIYIADLREYEVNFGQMTGALGILTGGDLAVLTHPNLRKTIVITHSSMVKIGTHALGQNQYGALRALVVDTPEAALEEALNELASGR